MKIQVSRILDDVFSKTFSEQDEWAKKKFGEAFGEHWKATDPFSGRLEVQKTARNLFFKGTLNFNYHAVCDRCVQDFVIPLKTKSERWMTPHLESSRERDIENSEESEITAEDTNFSFYKGDEIDLGDILVEQVYLDLPMVLLCKPDCKGLCGICGGNLNLQNCSCVEERKLNDSPFAVLKKVNKKSK